MNPSSHHLSPEYPVLFSISSSPPEARGFSGAEDGSTAYLSLALLVRGIPSFLATLPVDAELVQPLRESLDSGNVQVSVAGIDVDASDVAGAESAGDMAGDFEGGGGDGGGEAWRESAGTPHPDAFHTPLPFGSASAGEGRFPAAYLSLICRDGRKLGVARIVSRDRRATPEEVARYVLEQITSGVQIPDLASA